MGLDLRSLGPRRAGRLGDLVGSGCWVWSVQQRDQQAQPCCLPLPYLSRSESITGFSSCKLRPGAARPPL